MKREWTISLRSSNRTILFLESSRTKCQPQQVSMVVVVMVLSRPFLKYYFGCSPGFTIHHGCFPYFESGFLEFQTIWRATQYALNRWLTYLNELELISVSYSWEYWLSHEYDKRSRQLEILGLWLENIWNVWPWYIPGKKASEKSKGLNLWSNKRTIRTWEFDKNEQ